MRVELEAVGLGAGGVLGRGQGHQQQQGGEDHRGGALEGALGGSGALEGALVDWWTSGTPAARALSGKGRAQQQLGITGNPWATLAHPSHDFHTNSLREAFHKQFNCKLLLEVGGVNPKVNI